MVTIDERNLKEVNGGNKFDASENGYKDLIFDASEIIDLTKSEIENAWREGELKKKLVRFVIYFGVFNKEGRLRKFLPYDEERMKTVVR